MRFYLPSWLLRTLLFLILCPPLVLNRKLPDIHWNSANPMFRDHDPTKTAFIARIRDQLDIHCPLFDHADPNTKLEYLSIYMVSAFGFHNCVLHEAKPVARCLNPLEKNYATIVFREYTPSPGGLEFTPGHTYYFISTSNGTMKGIGNDRGGLCREYNMRLRIAILDNDQNSIHEPTPRPVPDHTVPPPPYHPILAAHWRRKFAPKLMAPLPIAPRAEGINGNFLHPLAPSTPPPLGQPFPRGRLPYQSLALADQPRPDDVSSREILYAIQEAVNSVSRPARMEPSRGKDYIVEYGVETEDYQALNRGRSKYSTLLWTLLCTLGAIMLIMASL